MRIMTITEDDKRTLRDILLKQVESELKGVLTGEKTINLKYKIADLFKKVAMPKYTAPFIGFTERAWLKMTELVRYHNTEVGAVGSVETFDGGYLITDIFVYPQKVTGSTCTSTDEYGLWLMDLPDEIFPKIRFQFHSHVHMQTNPSGVDETHREEMTTQINDFYIFAILNKRGDLHLEVYDKAKGVVFETKEIKWTIYMQDGSIDSWLEDTDKLLEQPARTAVDTIVSKYPLAQYAGGGDF